MTDSADLRDTLVIGAGSSGLAAAKNLRSSGIEVDVVEREREIGGNWNIDGDRSRVYASTHMISSKPFTQFPDFPMPDADPDYLHHTHVLAYLRRYAAHFGLDAVMQRSTSVVRCRPLGDTPDSGWEVSLAPTAAVDSETGPQDSDIEVRRYRRLVVANGHNWFPKLPTYPGQDGFTGEIIHSADFKHGDQLAGRRVVVVGAGNTGCDIAVEAAARAEHVHHSTRRGYWYAPKYAVGRPADQVSDLIFTLGLPLRATQWLFEQTAKLVVGRSERFGLPTPDHHVLEAHPIVNQTLLYHIGHGDITPVGDIRRFDGDVIEFVDGRRTTADLVVFATGYLIRLPFLDDGVLSWCDGRPLLYRNMLPPDRSDLAVIGLIQPDSGQFCLVHWQTVLLARLWELERTQPGAAAAWRRQLVDRLDERSQGGLHLLDSTRHLVEVEHLDYLADLEADIREVESSLFAPVPAVLPATVPA